MRGVQVAPSGEVRMVPPSPTTTSVVGEAATPRSVSVTPLARGVHAVPSGEVARAPFDPRATNWPPAQKGLRRRPPAGCVCVVQWAPSSEEVAMQAPTSEEPVATRSPASLAASPPRQGTYPPLVQARPSLDW